MNKDINLVLEDNQGKKVEDKEINTSINLVLKDKQGEKLEDKVINTSIKRLHEIKGDIKIRNEVVKEILHNAIEAKATDINITIKYNDKNNITIEIEYSGNELNSFESYDEILSALLDADESSKKDRKKDIGGKGRGAKILLSSGRLKVISVNNDKYIELELNNINNQIEAIKSDGNKKLEVSVIKNECIPNSEINKVIYIIDRVDTDDIRYFEHSSLVKYLQYFTVLGGVTDRFIDKSNISVNVRGLLKNKDQFKTKEEKEVLKIKDKFEELIKIGEKEKYSFNYIKCNNGIVKSNIESNELEKKVLGSSELRDLKEFFDKGIKCFIIRTKDSKFKKELRMSKAVTDGEFFGIYIGTQFVIINDRFKDLSKVNSKNEAAGVKSGGNVFTQYFGYVYNDNLEPTGNRNSISASENYYKFKDKLNKVMPIINKVLAAKELELKKEVVLKGVKENLIEGLWAELKYMEQQKGGFEAWTAYNQMNRRRCPHDFEFEDRYVQIKAKVDVDNIYKSFIKVKSVEELDDNRSGELRIYYLYEAEKGRNIIDLISDIEGSLTFPEDKNNLFKGIQNYLKKDEDFKVKYYDIMANRDNYDFSKLKKYEVKRGIYYDINHDFPACKSKILEAKKDLCITLDEGYMLSLSDLNEKGVSPHELK